ncbi:MAG: cysteine synthase A [Treponema sp.]|nr:cysteine synthase A [Treponema sp.]
MMLVDSITDLIGNTPLVTLSKINNTKAIIYAKLESFNPLHSVKDRVALSMIDTAEKDGKLKKGTVIIEPTSGNTGIGLAYISAIRGYRIILTMPDTMSIERQKLLLALGAEVVLTDGEKGMKGAIEKAEEIAASIPDSFIPQQFNNPANPAIHEKTTGPEIWNDTDGKIDILVCAVGTGGTITGTGRFLKSKNPSIKIIAVEPSSSPVLSGGKAGPHKIQGIGAGFIPNVYDSSVTDEIYQVNDEEAITNARRLTKEEGIFSGISSGAALTAALSIAQRQENSGKTIVIILPDSGEKYLSSND